RMRGSSGRMRGSGGRMRGSSAPVMSSDGYVMLFADETQMEADEFYTLQAASLVPEPPPWSTVVGNAYRLSASQSAPDLSAASVSFAYLGGDVPEGEEDWLRVYFRAPLSTTWQVLPTALDVYYNTASAPSQGEGLYALMSSLEIPLEAPGWNLFAYPVQATRPVSDALRSIEDYYGMVYGYKSTDASDPWKVYSPYVPSYVNDLYELEFGHGYWISVTQAITLYLKGASEEPLAPMDAIGGFPPSTYYGEVLAGDGFTPGVGMPVTAWVGGKLCGQGATRLVVGKIVYVVDVLADGWGGAAGCGAPGKTVTFKVGEQIMQITAAWDNRRLWNLDLYPPGGPLLRVFLPLVRR
ncbi:MAG: hypothetical protein JXA78_16910, partial [Anaerolineales bacterium]|nr:hypothetical protein [Anaerolineales bacterium]